MALPEEDLGPRSLRDYGFTDFGDIAADVTAMEEFAKRLAGDVEKSYVPHMERVTNSMSVSLPEPQGFPELTSFFIVHRDAQDATQSNIYNFAVGTSQFASAAQKISEKYRGSDAFAHAKVSDVETCFTQTATTPPSDPTRQGDV
jgi:hypothetical protein